MSRDRDAELHSYDNAHRAFLQAFLSRQSMTFEQARPIIAAIETADTPDRPTLENDVSQEDLDNYISTLNFAISRFDFEIRSTFHQTSRQQVYALVNTTSDALTQMATIHSADEIAFVKRVLDAMFDTYNTPRAEVMAVTSMQALKLAKDNGRREEGNAQAQQSSGGLTMSQAEDMLSSLVDEGWFEFSTRGFYSLTPRALMELRGWLMDTYNDQPVDEEEDDYEEERYERIKFCQACREIVTVGQRCPNVVCSARLHTNCVRNMFRAQGNSEQCPMCKTAWTDPLLVGEEAAKGGSRRSTNGVGRRLTSTVNVDGAGDGSDVSAGADG